MKIKTSELKGAALDWAVAVSMANQAEFYYRIRARLGAQVYFQKDGRRFNPSTNWLQGGPIIERERINITNTHSTHYPTEETEWFAEKRHLGRYHKAGRSYGEGTSALEAAMRCYVAYKLGDEIDVPGELL